MNKDLSRGIDHPLGRLFLGTLVIFALVFAVYIPMLPGSFIMDDHRLVDGDNPLVNGQLGLSSVWFQTDFVLSTIAMWAEWMAWGNHPGCYHALNMFLHGISVVLVWRILVRLQIPGAWVAGAIFAVHPVCVNSVARIAELKNTLSLPFFLLSLWFFLPTPNPQTSPRYILSLLAFILALFSKTSTVMLPFVLLACTVWQCGRITRQDLMRTAPFFILSCAFGFMSAWFQKHQAMVGSILPPETFWERLTLAGHAFWFYLEKALLPVNLNLSYPHWKIDATAPAAYIPVLLICATAVACWRCRRSWGRHVLFGLGVFAITLFPSLGFLDSQFLTKWQVSDHLQYLPLIAPIALAVGAIAAILPAAIFKATAAVLIVGLSLLTSQRARVFSSEETLFRDSLAKNPAAWGVHNDLGVLLAARENYPEAVAQFNDALKYNPDYADAESNLGQTLFLEGKLKEAEPLFRAALKTKPNDPEINRRFAMLLRRERRIPEALQHLRLAVLFFQRTDFTTRLDYANMLHHTGNFAEAEDQYRKVVLLQPDSVEALNNLAWLLATAPDDKLRDGAEAVKYADRASRLPPVEGMCVPGTLAAAYAEAGRFPEAVATAEKAIQQETDSGQTRFASMNQQLLRYYQAGRPFHEPPPNGGGQ